MIISKDTPIAMLTVGQLQEILMQTKPVEQIIVPVVEEKEDRTLTADEACEILRCGKTTLHKWKKEGLVPHVRIGNSIRYKMSDLQNVLKSKSR
jgi:excisionase family DNA binding protein